jgi:hypothetical protein
VALLHDYYLSLVCRMKSTYYIYLRIVLIRCGELELAGLEAH